MHNCVLRYELHSVRNYVPCLRCRQENDSDYEGQSQEEEDENYICALNEPETDEQQEGEETDEEEYEVPPFVDTMRPPQQLKVAKPKDHHGRGNVKQP